VRRPEEPEAWPIAAGAEILQDVSRITSPVEGYLRRYRHRVKTVFTDGSRSEAYVVDYVDRAPDKRDAAGFVLFARGPRDPVGATRILLRRQMRYAVYVAAQRPLTTEVFAGLIEGGETPEACVERETWEEAGVRIDRGEAIRLGRPFFPVPGLFTERIFPLAVQITPGALEDALLDPPPGDGSPFEDGSVLLSLTLDEAFELMEAPEPTRPDELTLDDAKTELILARLWRHLEK